MTLGNWALANPAGLWWALLALPIIALHILKPRRIRQTVAAIFLWKEVATPVTAARPWQRLIPSWLLFAQVLAAMLLALSLAEPVRLTPLALADHTIFVVDNSASMQANDGVPSRLESAAERASALRDQLPVGGEASLIVAGQTARALLTSSSDEAAFDRALEGLEPYDGTADFDNAFALAAGLNSGDRSTRVVFVSDGGIRSDSLRFAPAGTRFERVGRSATNRSIARLAVEPSSDGLVARITVRSHGGPASSQSLRVDVDGTTVDRRDVELGSDDLVNLSVRLPPGERIEAFLETDDALALDNRAVATVARRPELSVMHVGPANAFLDAALAAMEGVSVDRLDDFSSAGGGGTEPGLPDLGGVDIVIADRVNIPTELLEAEAVPVVAIAPPSGLGPISVTGEVERPILTSVSADSGLVAGLDFSDVLLARAQDVEVSQSESTSGADEGTSAARPVEVLLGANRMPLLLHARRAGADIVYFTFQLDESTLPLQAAFPVLMDRLLTDLGQVALPPPRLPVGARLPIDPRVEAVVSGPDGTSVTIAPGSTAPIANRMGFWRVEQPDRVPVLVAVNPEPAESAIAPQLDLPFPQGFGQSTDSAFRGEIPLWRFVVALLLVVVVAEWLLARRRIGVSRRQWNISQALRVAVAVALIAALIDLNINIPSDRVATVFLVDSSDSMSQAGRSEASQFVVDALAAKQNRGDDENLAGVVAFGRNARLENLASENPVFNTVSVDLDSAGTDLSAALRLGSAALPPDARQRLVVISDGRSTHGDLGVEVERLSEVGIPVDVVVIEPPAGSDTAVASVRVPTVVRVDEQVQVEATIDAASAADAIVTLRRDGEIVAEQTVSLTAGENSVTFTDTATDTGVLRYQVDVDAAGDPVVQNNRGFAAVPVSGVERVLVVDGDPNGPDGANLAAALAATGLNVDTVTVGGIPPLDELSQVASVVLVNVDRFDLSDAQVSTLSTAVRDLGRGLVTIGGDQAYALGGYRGSDLEEILPVESEITDPLRRQTVAQVLAIDTSGSMDACHCDEEGNNGLGGGNRVDGGVVKTVIAQQAAAKAIAALSATDEVGVLTMDNSDQWVIDLQANPSQEVIDDGLSQVNPSGPTILRTGLETAADELRQSKAALKHVILFSDGFTDRADLNQLIGQAASLADEGITVSVVATGEGAASDLEPVAEAGGGRFYPGRNLEQIPDIIVQETVTASRNFVTEGEFVPSVTSSADPVSGLTQTPVLDGYIATTPKPLARVDLRIGPDDDPLLASWQTGLGRVTSWTSDGGKRWSSRWAGWAESPSFWSGVVKETFPTTSDGGGVEVTIDGDQMTIRVEGVDDWADGATASARVSTPDGNDGGEGRVVPLERVDGSTFAATVAVDEAGVYAVGASVESEGETAWGGVGLSTRSYPAEYAPRPVDPTPLELLAASTGGRVQPAASDVFDSAGTMPGTQNLDWTKWLLWFAVLAWPVAVAVSRLSWRRGLVAASGQKASATIRSLQRTFPTMGEVQRSESSPQPSGSISPPDLANAPAPSVPPRVDASRPPVVEAPRPEPAPEAGSGETSLDQMLAAKRRQKKR